MIFDKHMNLLSPARTYLILANSLGNNCEGRKSFDFINNIIYTISYNSSGVQYNYSSIENNKGY